MNKLYKYGMRLRGFSIGCYDETNFYYGIIVYDRKMTDEEIINYELDYLGEWK